MTPFGNPHGKIAVLTRYLKTALRKAHYEMLPDDWQYYGEIAEYNGVYATAASLEACRDELEEVLEEWVLFRIHRNLVLPSRPRILSVGPGATNGRGFMTKEGPSR